MAVIDSVKQGTWAAELRTAWPIYPVRSSLYWNGIGSSTGGGKVLGMLSVSGPSVSRRAHRTHTAWISVVVSQVHVAERTIEFSAGRAYRIRVDVLCHTLSVPCLKLDSIENKVEQQ